MYQSSVKQRILSVREAFTPVERSLADFFLHNTKQMDFSSKNLSHVLYVSEAALSRFAKKCGYKGYRELIFSYQNDLSQETEEPDVSKMARGVHDRYWEILQHAFSLLDEEQVARASRFIRESQRVFVFGTGSSGLAAQEFQLRFMRLGLQVQAVTDPQQMRMQAALLGVQDLAVGITLSGKTKDVLEALHLAKSNGARTVLLTGAPKSAASGAHDVLLPLASVAGLDEGALISPQLPVLILTDMLYRDLLKNDKETSMRRHRKTLQALRQDSIRHTKNELKSK